MAIYMNYLSTRNTNTVKAVKTTIKKLVLASIHRRRINIDDNAKVVAAVCGMYLNAALSI